MGTRYSNKKAVTSYELRVTSKQNSTNSSLVTRHSSLYPVAFLWDESFLWGLMAYNALKSNGLSFDLVRSDDIKNGQLKNYKMLFVPGGWASNKLKALGEDGIKKIKEFVKDGGSYLGFCGGAGLATKDGIGLLNIKRKPTKERVPSFNGRIYLNINEHPIWEGLKYSNELRVTSNKFNNKKKYSLDKLVTNNSLLVTAVNNSSLVTRHSSLAFHAWWPSQFLVDKDVKILATYGKALSDAFSSDLNVADVEVGGDWQDMEGIYQINLDPKRLKDEPAVVEGAYGKGKVLLSLVHFDTPMDDNGAKVLRNLWKYLHSSHESQVTSHKSKNKNSEDSSLVTRHLSLINELDSAVSDLINLGIRNFLWYWRNHMLLQWRRGVRGLEYCTLYVMVKEIVKRGKGQGARGKGQESDLETIKKLLMTFIEKAKRLLILERLAMNSMHINYERCDNPEIQSLRAELFSSSKSHGGMFKALIDRIDGLLYRLIMEKG